MPKASRAAEANHIVISEIKASGGSGKTTDEFIELYNATGADINLDSWRLVKKTSSGSDYVLVDNFGNKTIRAHSFFLIAHPTGYLGTMTPDSYYTTTNSVSDNNSIILSDSAQVVVDMVGYGTATVLEAEAAVNPSANKSLERKALADSTAETMIEGGAHYFLGNSEDSDSNKSDFVIRDAPEPQNSLSESEYADYTPPSTPPDTDPSDPLPTPTYSKKVMIAELFPNPKGPDDGEFIELYNAGDVPVDINGWKLSDATARLFTISSEDFNSTVIAPHSYFVIEKKLSAISLNNTIDSAKLYHPNGAVISLVEYSGCLEGKSYSLINKKWAWTDEVTPGKVNKLTIKNEIPTASFEIESDIFKARAKLSFDASDSNDADEDILGYAWDFGDGMKTTGIKVEHTFQKAGKFIIRLTVSDGRGGEDETEQSVDITDYDYSNQLVVNELLPACQGADEGCEYIELYNPENRLIRLDGWRLIIKKTAFSFSADTVIKPRGYMVVKRQDSRLSLNNSGAIVNLVDPEGRIINAVEYVKAKDGLSFSRADGRQWLWSNEQTPGKQNEFSSEEKEDEGTKPSEEATKGENVEVKETSIDLSSMITPIAEATEDKLGDVLKVSALVESTSGSNIYLVDEAGNSLRVYIQKSTGIKKPDLKSGDQVEVTGILDKTSAGLRLLPRKQADIVVMTKQVSGQVLGESAEKLVVDVPIKDGSRQVKIYLLVAMIGVIVVAASVFIKSRLNKIKAPD